MKSNQDSVPATDLTQDSDSNPDPDRIFDTVPQFTKAEPAFTEGGTRWLIFNERKNGLKESGAIIRVGGKVLIHRKRFFKWMDAQNGVAEERTKP